MQYNDEILEKMIEEWQDNCVVTRDKNGKLERVSNEYSGLLFVKKNKKWEVTNLKKNLGVSGL